MRYHVVLLICTFLCITAFAQVKDDGPDPLYFKGRVKQAKVYIVDGQSEALMNYSVYETNGDRAYTISTYANDKRLLKLATYITNMDGTKQDITELLPVYNQNNRYIKYLEDGKPTKMVILDSVLQEQDYKNFIYNDDGLSQIYLHKNTGKGDKQIYTYEGDSLMTMISVNSKHNLTYYVYTYRLDDNGSPVQITVHTPLDDQTITITCKYKYDEQGNYTQAELYKDDVLIKKILRTISY